MSSAGFGCTPPPAESLHFFWSGSLAFDAFFLPFFFPFFFWSGSAGFSCASARIPATRTPAPVRNAPAAVTNDRLGNFRSVTIWPSVRAGGVFGSITSANASPFPTLRDGSHLQHHLISQPRWRNKGKWIPAVSRAADLHRTANAAPRRFRIWNHSTMFYGKQYAAGR